MASFSRRSRLVPLTMTVMALLFADKAVGLAREATSGATASTPSIASAQATPLTALAVPGQGPLPTRPMPLAAASPPASPVELQLLQDLRKRRQALDDREHRLDERSDLLQSTQVKLQARLDELNALQQRLEQAEDARHKRDSANWSGLVKTYEDMKPRDAAEIFNVLDVSVLLEVLDRMNERKAAPVLAAMLPERARFITQMLAQKRIRQDAIPAAATPPVLLVDHHT